MFVLVGTAKKLFIAVSEVIIVLFWETEKAVAVHPWLVSRSYHHSLDLLQWQFAFRPTEYSAVGLVLYKEYLNRNKDGSVMHLVTLRWLDESPHYLLYDQIRLHIPSTFSKCGALARCCWLALSIRFAVDDRSNLFIVVYACTVLWMICP